MTLKEKEYIEELKEHIKSLQCYLHRDEEEILELKEVIKRIRVDGRVENMPRDFRPLEASEELEAYWKKINNIKMRLDIKQGDNAETMLCKAYIAENGRESRTFEISECFFR